MTLLGISFMSTSQTISIYQFKKQFTSPKCIAEKGHTEENPESNPSLEDSNGGNITYVFYAYIFKY